MTLDVKDLSARALYGYLSTAVAPRPIALASTLDAEGNVNLRPLQLLQRF